MKTELKDIISFYIGCECIYDWGREPNVELKGKITPKIIESIYYNDGEVRWVKPLLRPLSDMTEEEAIEVTKPIVIYGYTEGRSYETYRNSFGQIVVSWGISHLERYVPQSEQHYTTEQFIYLIKQGFDIFGLIESNQAVDKTKIV